MNAARHIFFSLLPLCETLTYRCARDKNMNIAKLTYKAGQSSQADDSIYQEPLNASPSARIFRSTAIIRTCIILSHILSHSCSLSILPSLSLLFS